MKGSLAKNTGEVVRFEFPGCEARPWEYKPIHPAQELCQCSRLLPVGELLEENRWWWEMLAGGPAPDGEPFDANRHVIVGCDGCGFPLVWDQPSDLLARLDYRDTGALFSLGQTIGQFMSELFRADYPDDMWQEALRQLRGSTQGKPPLDLPR